MSISKKFPYWGICDVKKCMNEVCSQGICWAKTGYWCVCPIHSRRYRDGKRQPKMKQRAIRREKGRDANGYLAYRKIKEEKNNGRRTD